MAAKNAAPNATPRPARAPSRALTASSSSRAASSTNLQLEARAHIRVQREVDRLAATQTLGEPASVDFVRFLHEEFYRDAPDPLLEVRLGDRVVRVRPGAFRAAGEDVAVGRHLPPSSELVPQFMDYFALRYRLAQLGPAG